VKFIENANKKEYVRVCSKKPRNKPSQTIRYLFSYVFIGLFGYYYCLKDLSCQLGLNAAIPFAVGESFSENGVDIVKLVALW
jgi:hypothetical protein